MVLFYVSYFGLDELGNCFVIGVLIEFFVAIFEDGLRRILGLIPREHFYL